MATKAGSAEVPQTAETGVDGVRRRDFLNVAAVSFAGVGGVVALAPLLVQMSPSADVLAMAKTEVDISKVQPGQGIKVSWRKQPVFVRNLTPKEISEANAVPLSALRDPETLARPWAIPGTAGLQHRIGGIEKARDTGAVSYDPANHDEMVRTRQAKIDGIVRDIPDIEVISVGIPDLHSSVLGGKGVGELAIVGIAPAIANAVFHATGKRIRDLPITLEKLI